MADYMTMFVLMPDGERLPIEVDPYGTVDGIYASTSRALGMEPTRQAFVLRYQGDELDRGEELSSLTFTHGSEVELVRCERTKGEALRLLKKMHAVKKKTVAVTHAHLCQHAESGAQSVDRARQHAEIFVLFLDAGAPASPKVMTCAAKRGNHLAIAELAVRGVKPKPDALLELSRCKRVMNGGSRIKCLQLLMEAGGHPAVSEQMLLAFANLPDAECCNYIVENRAGREAAASALLTAIHINSSSAAIRFLCTRDSAQEDKDEALRAACVLGTTSSRGVVEVLREAGAKATRVSINKTVTAGWKATNHSDDAKWPEELWGALIDDGAQLGAGSDDSLTRAVQLLDLGLCRALVRRGHVAGGVDYLPLLANVAVAGRYEYADVPLAERRRSQIRTLLVEQAGQVETPVEDVSPARVEAVAAPVQTPRVQAVKKDGCCVVC